MKSYLTIAWIIFMSFTVGYSYSDYKNSGNRLDKELACIDEYINGAKTDMKEFNKSICKFFKYSENCNISKAMVNQFLNTKCPHNPK